MSISDRTRKVLEENEKKRKSSPNYNEMRIFLQQAKEKGILVKRGYSIPPIDTIGKRYTNYATDKVKK